MSLDKLLDHKRTYIKNDGEEYLNLITPTVNINDIKVNGYIRVNQDCKGRMDKQTGYGKTSYDVLQITKKYDKPIYDFSLIQCIISKNEILHKQKDK